MKHFIFVVIAILIFIPVIYPESWLPSSKLDDWYHPLDQCLLADDRNVSIDIITNDCLKKIGSTDPIRPIRCRVGNTWPSRSSYCDPTDIPFRKREHLLSSLSGYDLPERKVLNEFFLELGKHQGMFLMIGDSVMQQFFSAIACELERENVWTDPNYFTNTDETRVVQYPNISAYPIGTTQRAVSHAVATLKFLPIYHLVNGRYDKVPQAALQHLKTAVKHSLTLHSTVIILANMGLHYVDNPVTGFTKKDYFDQMTIVLKYFQQIVIEHPQHLIRIVWRETTAQHFPTPNGYWPGVRYAQSMKLSCVPILDPSPHSDWRNRIIEQIILQNNLFHIQILRFYNITLPLWSSHPNGNLRDCTHFCWFPMLYQPIFHYLAELVNKLPVTKTLVD
jgi:hypothetical protein